MTINVIIPTYRRPKGVERCLEALRRQARPADRVLVVVRDTDEETRAFLDKSKPEYPVLRAVTVTLPGQIAALNAGLEAAGGDIIAFTDDDAAPHTDWLERIEAHFQADSKIGGVGGRDWLYIDNRLVSGEKKIVGRILWFGRIIGNHHLGLGDSREVDHFKGTNMSFRREALNGIRFDESLRGIGAQFRNDMAFSLAVKRKGWKLIYDPEVGVDHYFALRIDEGQRGEFNRATIEEAAYNETLVLLKYLPLAKRITSLLWALLVGGYNTLGFGQCLKVLLREKKKSLGRLSWTLRGRWSGCKTWLATRK